MDRKIDTEIDRGLIMIVTSGSGVLFVEAYYVTLWNIIESAFRPYVKP